MENNKDYNPDVLNCIANLSNDEVFTPPQLVNEMLDLLPQELFSNPQARFLDPFTKSGVFLREIVKRLDVGLASIIPDRQERILHIMHNQIFGIALTELTSLLARRSVYCSKYANSEHSIGRFKTKEGYILYTPMQHSWQNGRCQYCGASKEVFDRGDAAETYAYNFIHTNNPEKFFPNMTFDVIIGNPPYQMNDGGGTGSSAMPLYDKFVQQAMKLQPKYLSMIIPARWYAGGKGLDEFRNTMLNDNRISHLVDYFDSTECFPGVDISGGVCYFLWNKDYHGDCIIESRRGKNITTLKRPLLEEGNDSFVRFNEAINIWHKIKNKGFKSFVNYVSSRKPFGDFNNINENQTKNSVLIYAYPHNGYVENNQILQNKEWVRKYKVFIAKAYGERGEFPYLVLGKPFLGDKNTCCTETYLVLNPCSTREEAENVISYIKTRFFRFFVLFKKNTQNAARGVYQFVPLQDFSEPWTDEKLYKKYNLTSEEIAFIESMIRPME